MVLEDMKCLNLSRLFTVSKFQLDFTRIGENTYFKAKDAFDSYIQSSPELQDSNKPLLSMIEQTLKLLAFRFDIDEGIQAQKDAHARVCH